MKNTLTPCIWFHTEEGRLAEVIAYYGAVFREDFTAGDVTDLGETPDGKAEMCNATFFGQPYMFMSTADEHHKLSDAVSFIVSCDGQEEIDKYWDYFTTEGEESQCGWCIDKYGLRWQVIPTHFDELMTKPNAWETMLGQKKIIIGEY